MVRFFHGDEVVTSTGMTGEVVAVDDNRKIVAVKADSHGVGHKKGDEVVFKQKEVKKV